MYLIGALDMSTVITLGDKRRTRQERICILLLQFNPLTTRQPKELDFLDPSPKKNKKLNSFQWDPKFGEHQ